MRWPLDPVYNGQDVFIIGGGPSVKEFPISKLTNKNVIGCNDAYTFGTNIIDVLVFGDKKWYLHHKEKLVNFNNPIITNHPELQEEPGIICAPRFEFGFFKDGLGWNYNTGSMAINVALLLGATNIFLVGFDMHLGEKGESNWHKNVLDRPNKEVYTKFQYYLSYSVKIMEEVWPDVKVWNLNLNSSLDLFPKCDWKNILGGE